MEPAFSVAYTLKPPALEIRIFQIIVPLVSLIFLTGIWVRYRRGRVNLREFSFSLAFWLGLTVFSLFPDPISNFLAELFGIKSNVNAVIFLSLGVIIYLLFLLFGEVRENRRQLTDLARKIALRDAERELE